MVSNECCDFVISMDTICSLSGLNAMSECESLKELLQGSFGCIIKYNSNYFNSFTEADVEDMNIFYNIFESKIEVTNKYVGLAVQDIQEALGKFIPKKELPGIIW